jgi:hypothetical protein
MRNRAGITQRCPTGTVEKNIAMLRRPKAGGDVVWDTAVPAGRCVCILTGNLRDDEVFYRANFPSFFIYTGETDIFDPDKGMTDYEQIVRRDGIPYIKNPAGDDG